MIKVACLSCAAPYDLDERRLPASGLKMRCPKCGTTFQVFPDGRVAAAPPAHKKTVMGIAPPNVTAPAPPAPSAPAGDIDLPAPATPKRAPIPMAATAAPPKRAPIPMGPATAPARPPEPPKRAPIPMGPAVVPPPAAIASPQGSPPPQSRALDDLDLDLPAPRGAKPAPAPAAEEEDDFDLDLPAPRAAATAPAALESDLDFDLPAPRAARGPTAPAPPRPGGGLDLPAPREPAALGASPGDLDLDLPAPRPAARKPLAPAFEPGPATKSTDDFDFDLPAPRGAAPRAGADELDLDLPAPRQAPAPALADVSRTPFDDDLELPAVRSDADLPAPRAAGSGIDLDLDLPGPRGGAQPGGRSVIAAADDAFGDLDLPVPSARAASSGFGDIDLPVPRDGALDLPAPASVGLPAPAGVGLPAPSRRGDVADLPVPRASHADLPSPAADAAFGDLELPLPGGATARSRTEDDDLALPTPATPATRGGVRGHGELDLGADPGAPEDMEFADIPQASPGGTADSVPPAADRVSRPSGKRAPAAKSPPKRGRTALVLIGIMLALVGVGAGLSFTPYGPFGMYALEPFLPGAGDPAAVAAVIREADELALRDVRPDSWQALVRLGSARRDAGLDRELLSRSLLHESLYQIRFGADAEGAARAAAIRERLTQRESDDPRAALALAADQVRGGNTAIDAHIAAARRHAPSDPFVDLIEGEAALAAERPADAASSFRAALEHGGGAVAQWGLARALMAGEDAAAIDAAIDATLEASPRHAAARVAKARRHWDRAEEAEAIALARQVAGLDPVEGESLRAAASDRADALVLLGRVHEHRGRTSAALQSYESAREIDGRRVEAALGAGRMLLEQSPSEALARFEAVLAVEGAAEVTMPSGRTARDEARLGAARSKLSLRRIEEARSDLEALVAERPEDAAVSLWLGRAEQQLEHADAAEQHFRETIRLAPTVFEGYLALAQLYVEVDRGSDALAVLEQARAQVPETASMRQRLGMFELGRNRLPEAVRELRRALELDPQLPSASFGLGVALRRSGRLADAAAVFEQLAEIDPGHPGLALERGLLYEARGESERAVRFYTDALAESPDDTELLLRLGAAQVAAGQLDAAEESLTRVQRATPTSAEAEHFLGRVHFARRNLPAASQHFERALALDASRGEFFLYAAWAALDDGQIGRALDRVQEALRRDPSLGDAYWIRGAVRLRTGAVRDALSDLQRALELRPQRTEAMAAMGECYDQLRQLPQAIASYERAVAARDSEGEWWYRLGRLRLDAGQRAEAARALSRATLLGDATTPQPGWLADAHRLQADALRLGGERAGAVEHYRRYLEIAPPGAIDRADVRRVMMDLGAVPPPE